MVRAHVKQSDDEKKETRKKKTPAKAKKSSEAGIWPCKINGCNKQFAREADLKRHQRTTKNHAMPGFTGSACPQCDATFTRTDALRRHQKSRHNGVIIEPAETQKIKEDGENEAGSSGSKPESRSTSPTTKTKGKGRAKKNATDTPTALANPGTAGPSSGPSSYYRQHTMQNVFLPQGMMIDPQQYAQGGLGLPTSATRLHQASWPPPPPWAAEGPQAQMGTISYHPGSQPGFYQPSPYYRQNGAPMSGGPPMQQQFVAQTQEMQNGMPPHSIATPAKDNEASRTGTPATQTSPSQPSGDVDMKDASQQGTGEGQPVPAAPVIDPSLDMSAPAAQTGSAQGGNVEGGSQAPTTKPVSLEITQAAMEAVLQSAQRESNKASGTPDAGAGSNTLPANGHVTGQTSSAGSNQQTVGEGGLQGSGGTGVVNSSSGGGDTTGPSPPHTTGKSPFAAPSTVPPQPVMPPEPMEPMLTEDGEPMLNPAELLTQESLASPPSS